MAGCSTGMGLPKGSMLAYSSFVHAAPLSSAPPSVPSSPSSHSGAPTPDKVPSTEMEALTAAQQGMLNEVSLHKSAPHSVVQSFNDF